MTVVYRVDPTGRTPHETVEVLLTQECPSCGASWVNNRVATPRHAGQREFRCEACGVHHRATKVDIDGRPVPARRWVAPGMSSMSERG